jgi:translation initiation factor RLI1
MPNGQEKEITKKEQMEYYIMKSNEQKYHQTEGHGQLQKGQLLTEVGITGTGPKSAQILEGSYKPPAGTNYATKQFLTAMKKPTNYSHLKPITFHDFCEGWRKAKERTCKCNSMI